MDQSHYQQQASYTGTYADATIHQQPTNYDPYQGGSEKDAINMSTFANIPSSNAQILQRSPHLDQDRTRDDLMEDHTPYGRARHQIVTSYSVLQSYLDKTIPHTTPRWAVTGVLAFLFWCRVLSSQGYYVVAYTQSIYFLNIFLLFLTPKFLPDLDDDSAAASPTLPTRADEEFRPFIRRLPEFQFWLNGTASFLYSLIASMFPIFDIPVFWPILVVYFVALFAFTMRRQIEHMIRHKYIPFDFGKKRFGGSR